MITKNQYEALIDSATVVEYTEKMNQLKEYLSTLGLTFQPDYDFLILEYKTKLFGELMKVDKGLAHEYNTLLKTDAAKAAKIDAKIDLDGHEQPVIIKEMLNDLKIIHNRLFTSFKSYGTISFSELVTDYHGVVADFLKQSVIDWSGLESYKTLFEDAFTAINKLVPVYRSLGYSMINGAVVINRLNDLKDSKFVNDKFDSYALNELELYTVLKSLKK